MVNPVRLSLAAPAHALFLRMSAETAEGSPTQKSDIDLSSSSKRSTYDNFLGLIRELEKLFGRNVEVLTPDGVDSISVDEVAQSIRDSVVYV